MTLTDLRAAVAKSPADTSNPLTVVRTASGALTPRRRSDLYNQALAAGFRTFRGVGLSTTARLGLGAVPEDERAESLEIQGRRVTLTVIELTDAGRAAVARG